MTSPDLSSRKPAQKSDDFIQDYISDIWGASAAYKKETASLDTSEIFPEPAKPNFAVDRAHSLVPTLKYPSSTHRQLLTPTDNLVLLSYALLYLRKPLSPKLRCHILMTCEKLIEDFQAACWLKEFSDRRVMHEV
jgi:hypothetical protein